jgi:predicted  nucleic acid-binding Zn-ribbon protein
LNKLDMLWKYQQKELELEQAETALKNSPVRQHLLKIKNFLLKQQNDLKKYEEIAAVKNQRIAELDGEYEKADARLQELLQQIDGASDAQEARTLRNEAETIQNTLIKLRRELMDIIGDIEKIEGNIRVMATKVLKARGEYAEYKETYDQEKKDASGDLNRLKLEAEEIAKGIDAALLKRYDNLKKSKADPMALIVENKCGGCNMELPSLVLHRLKSGEETIECENCGRILYYKES